MQGEKQGERKNRVKKIEDSSCSLFSHFWSTSRSPFSTFYIPFQRSGSQESNASTRVRFGAEMRKLQPLEDDCSKLKEGFSKVLRNHPLFRNDFAAFLHSALDFPWSFTPRWKPNTTRWKPTSQWCRTSLLLRSNFAALFGCLRNLVDLVFTCEMVLSASRYLRPTLWDIFLQIFVSKFPFSPCIQPLM